MKYTIMTVRSLIAQLRGLDLNARVVLSIDEEGNGFNYMLTEGGVEPCTVDSGKPAVLLMPYGPSCEPDYSEEDLEALEE